MFVYKYTNSYEELTLSSQYCKQDIQSTVNIGIDFEYISIYLQEFILYFIHKVLRNLVNITDKIMSIFYFEYKYISMFLKQIDIFSKF